MAFCSEWTALVITCKTRQCAAAYQQQLELKQSRGLLSKDLIVFSIEDPQDDIGSGGATLNALLVATEHLSMKKGYTVVTSDVLSDAKILIIHMGRYFPYDPCGRSFVCLPLVPENGELEDLVTNFDCLFYTITKQLANGSPPGLWVCSSDMLFQMPDSSAAIDWSNINVDDGVLAIAVPESVEYALHHGVYKIDEDNCMKDLIFQGTQSQISACCVNGSSKVPLVTGIVFFSTYASEKLLTTHATPPLDGCTYLGSDRGIEPVCISLFFDLLLAMATGINKKEFVIGERSGAFGKSSSPLTTKQKQFMQHARSVLWKYFNGIKLKVKLVEEGVHSYLDMWSSPMEYCSLLRQKTPVLPGFKQSMTVHSHVDKQSLVGENVLLINSVVEKGAMIGNDTTLVHCHVTENVSVGSNCYCYGLNANACRNLTNGVPDKSSIVGIMVEFSGKSQERLFACTKIHDRLLDNMDFKDDSETCLSSRAKLLANAISSSKFLPYSYRNVMAKANKGKHNHTLFMARIFPIFHYQYRVNISHSLKLLDDDLSENTFQFWFDCAHSSYCEMVENVNHIAEFDHRLSLYFDVASRKLIDVLSANLDTSLLPFFKTFVLRGKHQLVFDLLDSVAIDAVDTRKLEGKRPDISARAFACIADVLGYMAWDKAGLRSGPSANKKWKEPLHLLECGNIKDGVLGLARVREKWLHNPDLLIRAARHYEGAEQILIRHAVKSVACFIKSASCSPLEDNIWYIAECPARIDLSGGWTDTPPLCYEFGGSVVNAALLIEGKRPIGARIRKIKNPVILLTLLGSNDLETTTVECSLLEHLMDYFLPQSPAALLKACIVLARLVNIDSMQTMEEQLMTKYGGGFELQTWSRLPQGSGLGTSSILAGAVLRVVFKLAGQSHDSKSIIYSVLLVEQLLTTGGGWQDQIGGLIGGVKIGRSAAQLPLSVTTEVLNFSDEFILKFSAHLKLIYTGKTRLARNLLQNVLRNWYTKRPDIVKNCCNLKSNAEACAEACKTGDLSKIGTHINMYWQQKKVMASGCEPELCARMMRALSPYALGQSLAGAGGGGFLYLLTKEPMTKQAVSLLLKGVEGAQDVVVYDVGIDRIGMTCYYLPTTST
ncbi:L-fucose kinase-like [Clavelina lepadiformis]|uniref:L-fucose kinase n=1 Tax=Clavelina lepadiformis TaxID=159417 RepID=A0ABP0EYU4_CLALP